MSDDYTYQTYPTAFVTLEAGTYTREQLQDLIAQIDALNVLNMRAVNRREEWK
jgi:hypothetical protein